MPMDREKRRVLVISNFYLPGTRSGGGTRTIVNTVDRLSDRFEFHIITRGYDAGMRNQPYPDVKTGRWNEVGGAKVFYLDKDSDLVPVLSRAINEIVPSLIYANSFFSDLTVRALGARRIGRIPRIPFVIAPCGELSEGALGLKSLKKRTFLRGAVVSGLYSDLVWKASSEAEAAEFRELGLKGARILVAPDLPPRSIFEEFTVEGKPAKVSGEVRFVFLSRFDRKKNLKWLIDNAGRQSGRVSLDVYGNIADDEYLSEFTSAVAGNKGIVEVQMKGEVEYRNVPETLYGYDFFVLPTLGENFGHVFLEALASGCPLLISDRTPWNDIESHRAGWTISLESPESWQDVIGRCVEMEEREHKEMSSNARKYAERFLADPGIENATLKLFESAIALGTSKTGMAERA